MKKQYAKYSEELYVNKLYLRNIYPTSIAELMFEEIKKYREFYKCDLHFCERPFFITMNPYLFNNILSFYELDTIYIQNVNSSFLKKKKIDIDEIYEMYESKQHLNEKLYTFLNGEMTLLIKVYIVFFYVRDPFFMTLILQMYQKSYWNQWIHEVSVELDEFNNELDITYGFRSFLEQAILWMKKEIEFSCDRQWDKDELSLKYPQVSNKSISFYLTHSKFEAYYTISQYQNVYHCSYECARLAMEQMRQLGWYKKIKVGKKYVYSPVLRIKQNEEV